MADYASMDEAALRRHVGSMQQVAGIRTSTLDDGKARGLRVADVNNGSGLTFTVLLDRGMDIGQAAYRGTPLAFLTPVGYAHPAYFEPDGLRWLRNWHAGLLTGCGLSNAGAPEKSGEFSPLEPLGLHGRLSNIPAEKCAVCEEWAGGRYRLSVAGTVRHACMFGENLELTRTISTAMGENAATVEDRVTNRGLSPSPLMLLYHINIGFPILDKNARLETREHEVAPRTPAAEPGLPAWPEAQAPTAGYEEQCFYHDIPADNDGLSRIRLRNPALKLGVEVAYRKKELPFFTQWKMMGEGAYVMGLEPANCHCEGQTEERKNGTLQEIQPGETVNFLVRIGVVTS
ncbi:MAG: aldose 1-epimerase family protein [Kiritimatiellae bacterium]|nr:aldose 1-epimerase family protein [Kiritimatiellia bacterium]